ncbi:MAG: acyl-CoA/acyl-ACP dehydrogenase [Acidimicrobiia bacterium]|nr:acyl-CoA/acyl-ACP dehydrogenase [Acidimicrobiia bacterium]
MELEFSEDQQELRSTVRAFLERECPMTLVRSVVEKGGPADELWTQMVDLGWPALTIGEDQGGLGLGFVELAVLAEELGRVIAPGPFVATVTQFVPVVRHTGTGEQQQRFLGAVAAGELTGALAIAGDVVASANDGSWTLSGTVRHVLDGDRANEVVVVATVGDRRQAFVVPGDQVQAQPTRTLDRSRHLATVTLDGVRVDDDRALTPDEDALDRAVEEATAALAIEIVGTCQSIFDVALAYSKERHQFGVPIGSFQAIKHKFADMLVALERARATAYFAAATIAEEDDRRTLAVAMAKAAAGDAQRLIAQEGIQTMGGIGYTWEHDMHLYVKRAKASDALFGTSSEHRARVARILGL